MWKSNATQCTDDCDENYTAESGNGDLAEPTRGSDADKTGQPASDETTQQSDYQVAARPKPRPRTSTPASQPATIPLMIQTRKCGMLHAPPFAAQERA